MVRRSSTGCCRVLWHKSWSLGSTWTWRSCRASVSDQTKYQVLFLFSFIVEAITAPLSLAARSIALEVSTAPIISTSVHASTPKRKRGGKLHRCTFDAAMFQLHHLMERFTLWEATMDTRDKTPSNVMIRKRISGQWLLLWTCNDLMPMLAQWRERFMSPVASMDKSA